MKRLDLIFNEKELKTVIEALDKSEADGYSVIRHVTGRGPHGSVSEDLEFTGVGSNVHVIVFCMQDTLENLRAGNLASILEYYGGVVYLSEAEPFDLAS